MADNNIHDYTERFFVPLKYLDKNIKVKSDDPYIINNIKKIVGNVRKLVKQMEPNMRELDQIFIKLPFNNSNPIILGYSFTNRTTLEYYYKDYRYLDFAKNILPLNVYPNINYKKLYYGYCLPIQLLDYISNFDNILDIIYYKMSNDGNIHIFTISLYNQNRPYIDYIGTDISLIGKVNITTFCGLNDDQIIEKFLKIVEHIFHSPAKSARN